MLNKILFLLSFSIFTNYGFGQSPLELKLYNLADVSFEKIATPEFYESAYEIKVKQPLDHNDHSKGYFYQKVYLSHKGYEKNNVIVTEGYTRNRNFINELTEVLDANQLAVEHRFFGESMPDTLNYDFLNLEQATADLHHIRSLFAPIYHQKWVSTGISKGGATTIFYRYFYPEDVDVSVPYVAPINREFEDQRLYTFLDTIGSDSCREAIYKFQKDIFNHRSDVLPLLKFYSLGAQANYDYLSLEEAFEYTVLEYPFSFWQYGHDCTEIPTTESSIEDKVQYLLKISDITFFADKAIENYGSHYYQSAEEMGYYGYQTAPFRDHLKSISTNSNPHATFLPEKINVKFEGDLLININKWLQKDAHKMIYINGALDTWSATAVPINKKVDAEWFFLKDKHHANARIKSMSDKEKQRLSETFKRWGIENNLN